MCHCPSPLPITLFAYAYRIDAIKQRFLMRLATKARTEKKTISTILKNLYCLGVQWGSIQNASSNTAQLQNGTSEPNKLGGQRYIVKEVRTDADEYCKDKNGKDKECGIGLEAQQTDEEDSIRSNLSHERFKERVERVDSMEANKELFCTVEATGHVAESSVPRLPLVSMREFSDVESSLVELQNPTFVHEMDSTTQLSEEGSDQRPKFDMRALERDEDCSESDDRPHVSARLRAQKRKARLKHLKKMKQRSLATNLSPQPSKGTNPCE